MKIETNGISIIPINSLPEIKPGDNLVQIISTAITKEKIQLRNGDILTIAQKIISKAEDRIVSINETTPSPYAVKLGNELNKDPRLIEIILGETKRIVRMDLGESHKGRLIVETLHGIVCANAGVDASNVSGGDKVTLLPKDPDASAKSTVETFKNRFGIDIAVIITDTVGRPWRMGLTEIAIGCWGMKPLKDYRGQKDSKGYELNATIVAIADEIAGAAGLVMKKTGATPVVIVRGLKYDHGGLGAKELIRNPEEDLFR
jgi:coenzyme F420-0:L-glutamate ligase / coenzyme F420-1:gamma-L-glutamate ligase